MTVDPLNSTAYVVTLAVLFGGGYAAFKGALWWQGYRDARREAHRRTPHLTHDSTAVAGREVSTVGAWAPWRTALGVAVIGLALAVEVGIRTDQVSGGMFAAGVLIVVALLRPAWAAGLFIAVGEIRRPVSQKAQVRILQDPWGVYPMLGSAAFLLLGVPVAEIFWPDAGPAAIVLMLPCALLAWICLALEPLVWRGAGDGANRSMPRRIFRHPLAVAVASAACAGVGTAIIEWFSPPFDMAFTACGAYVGALFGVLGWESVVGVTVRTARTT